MKIAIISLTRNGSKIGAKLAPMLGADLYMPERYKGDIKDGIPFSMDLRGLIKDIFYRYNGLIFVMAVGIVVRSIASLIKDKGSDPAVVVMDEKGRFAISLLSGHLGGANDLARRIGELIGVEPVITTATDLNGLPGIDSIAREFNLIIEDISKIKMINSAILEGEKIVVYCRIVKLRNYFKRYPDQFDIYDIYDSKIKNFPSIFIDNRTAINGETLPNNLFILRPRNLIVGIGCNRGTKKEEFKDLYFSILKEYNLSHRSVRNIATMDIKKDEEGLIQFAEEMGLKIEFYSKKDFSDIALPSGISMNALINVGVGGVCEPAALRSAEAEELLVKKIKKGNVTIAIAEAVFI